MLRVDERALYREMQSSVPPSEKPAAALGRHGRLSSAPGLTFGLERYVLSVLIQRPESLVTMNDVLVGLGLEPLGGEDFAQVEERALFEQMAEYIAEHGDLDVDGLLQHTEPELRRGLDRILNLGEGVSFPSDEQAESDAIMCAARLRELRLHRRNEELLYLQKDARGQGDVDAVRRWGQMVDQLAIRLARLQREKGARDSLGYLRRREPSRN
jgi:hypothetical protein